MDASFSSSLVNGGENRILKIKYEKCKWKVAVQLLSDTITGASA